MSKCVNEHCQKDPMSSIDAIVATADGDFACCCECLVAYENQRDHFLDTILPDDNKFMEWIKA